MTQEPRQVVLQMVDAYNAKSLEDALSLYHPEAFFWDPFHREGVRGRDAIAEVVSGLFNALPDEQMQIETLVADERHAVAEFRSLGTTPDGDRLDLEFTEVFEVSGGRIVSCLVYIDPREVPGGDQMAHQQE
jgi:ketosteroid isomerase-like protein